MIIFYLFFDQIFVKTWKSFETKKNFIFFCFKIWATIFWLQIEANINAETILVPAPRPIVAPSDWDAFLFRHPFFHRLFTDRRRPRCLPPTYEQSENHCNPPNCSCDRGSIGRSGDPPPPYRSCMSSARSSKRSQKSFSSSKCSSNDINIQI